MATMEQGHAAVRYVNPTTGGDVMPTIRGVPPPQGRCIHPATARSRIDHIPRSGKDRWSSIGLGRSSKGDLFVVPSCCLVAPGRDAVRSVPLLGRPDHGASRLRRTQVERPLGSAGDVQPGGPDDRSRRRGGSLPAARGRARARVDRRSPVTRPLVARRRTVYFAASTNCRPSLRPACRDGQAPCHRTCRLYARGLARLVEAPATGRRRSS